MEGVRRCRSLLVTCTYPQSIEFSRTDMLRDIIAYMADAMLQPFAVVQAKGLEEGAAERLRPALSRVLTELADGALDQPNHQDGDVVQAEDGRGQEALGEGIRAGGQDAAQDDGKHQGVTVELP